MGRRTCFVASAILLLMGIVRAQAQAQDQDLPDLRVEKGTYIARGKWNPTEGKHQGDFAHLPLAEIHCFKDQSFCMQAIASAQNGLPGLAVQYYRVVRWDKSNLLAENQDFSCTTNQLKIDLKENIVLAVDSPRKKGKPEKGKAGTDPCNLLAHAITYKLVGETSELPAQQPGASPPAP